MVLKGKKKVVGKSTVKVVGAKKGGVKEVKEEMKKPVVQKVADGDATEPKKPRHTTKNRPQKRKRKGSNEKLEVCLFCIPRPFILHISPFFIPWCMAS